MVFGHMDKAHHSYHKHHKKRLKHHMLASPVYIFSLSTGSESGIFFPRGKIALGRGVLYTCVKLHIILPSIIKSQDCEKICKILSSFRALPHNNLDDPHLQAPAVSWRP